MFTVLIQNEKTMDSFYEHLPLFNRYLSAEQKERDLEVCLWNENGQSLEEALPDLHHLTDTKEHWRAVIVRYEDGDVMKKHPTFDDNPYDFGIGLYECSYEDAYNIPLLRMVQMLSKPLEFHDRSRSSQNTLFPSKTRVQRWDGVLPDSITLITVRNTDVLQSTPMLIHELEHPEFASRNGYSSVCRFAVVDRISQGYSRKVRSDFEFWSVVLMLARNRLDSSFMEAYQLYSLSCQFNQKEMAALWNAKKEQLERKEQTIEHFLRHQSVYLEKQSGKYPDFETKIEHFPSDLMLPKETIPAKPYLAMTDDPKAQKKEWVRRSDAIEERLQQSAERFPYELLEKMPALQKRPGYDPDEVSILNPLQMEKLQAQIEKLNVQIIQEQSRLPKIDIEDNKSLQAAARRVADLISEKPLKKQLLVWTAGLAAGGLLVFVPSWIGLAFKEKTGWMVVIIFTILLIFVPIGLRWWNLWKEKKRLRSAISAWNSQISEEFDRLQSYKEQYIQYIADVLSYRRGHSYLEITQKKAEVRREQQRILEARRDDIRTFLRKLKLWADSMNVKVKEKTFIQADQPLQPKSVEKELAELGLDEKSLKAIPLKKRREGKRMELLERGIGQEKLAQLFWFEPEIGESCEVNETGRKIDAPFSFVERLNIEQVGKRNYS